jgi:hypothetical protein
MTIQTKKSLLGLMAGVVAMGIVFSVGSERASVYEGAAEAVEKTLSIDINDFYYQTTIPVAFTTGSTNGTDLTANDTSTCEIPVSGRLGHVLNDISGGYRINDTTLNIRISLGDRILKGVSGYVYTTTSRSIRLVQNTVPGTTSYVSNNASTYINIGSTGSAPTLNTPTLINRINITQNITGQIEIRASGSVGLTELILYYTE